MRLSWKCLIVSKTLVRTKLQLYPFWKNLGLISIFGPVGPKSKNPHELNSLNFLTINETILEMPYCQLNFSKNRLEILTFERRPWSWFPYVGPLAQNKKRPLIETYGLLGVLNTLLAFSYPGETNYGKKPYVS